MSGTDWNAELDAAGHAIESLERGGYDPREEVAERIAAEAELVADLRRRARMVGGDDTAALIRAADVIEHLRTSLDAHGGDDAALRRMVYDESGMTVTLQGFMARWLSMSAVRAFIDAGAENYCEWTMGSPELGMFTLRIQRKHGKTPAEVNGELMARVAELEERLARGR